MTVPRSPAVIVNDPILPGATLGVLGSGQLGRMFTIAARRLGYRVHVFSPDDDTPTGQVADVEVRADYHDLDRVTEFARQVEVVTFEFENVPFEATVAASQVTQVRPRGEVLYTSQNRQREKTHLQQAGLPVTPFRLITSETDLSAIGTEWGWPVVLKTADWGYDGKGQIVARSLGAAQAGYRALNTAVIAEKFIPFRGELSVVGVRGVSGEFASYGPIWNSHANHILDVSVCPAPVSQAVHDRAIDITRAVLTELDVVGVLCVEFFLTHDDELLINETAPRPHNSGHLTIDAHVSCQFEQQVRAVCGLPLGSTRQTSPAAMANLLGDVWQPGPPRWDALLAAPDVKLHLYGKREARPGRKMGHITALATDAAQAETLARLARDSLIPPG